MNFDEVSDKHLVRIYRIMYARISRIMSGDPWGWDLPTLRVLYPHLAHCLSCIITEGKARKL